jgi:hypothetical protein
MTTNTPPRYWLPIALWVVWGMIKGEVGIPLRIAETWMAVGDAFVLGAGLTGDRYWRSKAWICGHRESDKC